MYQKYLEGVLLSTGEEFGEIKDIIARFDTLEATNKVFKKRLIKRSLF